MTLTKVMTSSYKTDNYKMTIVTKLTIINMTVVTKLTIINVSHNL